MNFIEIQSDNLSRKGKERSVRNNDAAACPCLILPFPRLAAPLPPFNVSIFKTPWILKRLSCDWNQVCFQSFILTVTSAFKASGQKKKEKKTSEPRCFCIPTTYKQLSPFTYHVVKEKEHRRPQGHNGIRQGRRRCRHRGSFPRYELGLLFIQSFRQLIDNKTSMTDKTQHTTLTLLEPGPTDSYITSSLHFNY